MCVFATYRSIYKHLYVVKNFYPTTQRTWPSNMARILSILSSLALLILTSAAQDTSALTITYTKHPSYKCQLNSNGGSKVFLTSGFTTTTSGIGNMDSQTQFSSPIGSGARGGNANRVHPWPNQILRPCFLFLHPRSKLVDLLLS